MTIYIGREVFMNNRLYLLKNRYFIIIISIAFFILNLFDLIPNFKETPKVIIDIASLLTLIDLLLSYFKTEDDIRPFGIITLFLAYLSSLASKYYRSVGILLWILTVINLILFFVLIIKKIRHNSY